MSLDSQHINSSEGGGGGGGGGDHGWHIYSLHMYSTL